PGNLRRYLDLIEAEDPAILVVLGARRHESPRVRDIIHGAGTALAHGVAHNQLGDDAPSELVLSALRGFLGFFDVVLDDWRAGRIQRAEVEVLVAETL